MATRIRKSNRKSAKREHNVTIVHPDPTPRKRRGVIRTSRTSEKAIVDVVGTDDNISLSGSVDGVPTRNDSEDEIIDIVGDNAPIAQKIAVKLDPWFIQLGWVPVESPCDEFPLDDIALPPLFVFDVTDTESPVEELTSDVDDSTHAHGVSTPLADVLATAF